MTTRRAASPIMEFKPSASKAERERLQEIADLPTSGALTLEGSGRKVKLPNRFAQLLRAMAAEALTGHEVQVLRADVELTPKQAAEMLGLSRQFVARLLDEGALPSRRLPGSAHRRIKLDDVIAFAARRDRRRAGVNEIVDSMTDAGVDY